MTIIAFVPIAIDEEDNRSLFNPLASHLASIFDAQLLLLLTRHN